MEIEILWDDPLAGVYINEGRTQIDLGLLDKDERKELAAKLREAADELDPQGTE